MAFYLQLMLFCQEFLVVCDICIYMYICDTYYIYKHIHGIYIKYIYIYIYIYKHKYNEALYLSLIVEYLLNMFYCWEILVFLALSDGYICFCLNIRHGSSCFKLVVYSFVGYIYIYERNLFHKHWKYVIKHVWKSQ